MLMYGFIMTLFLWHSTVQVLIIDGAEAVLLCRGRESVN